MRSGYRHFPNLTGALYRHRGAILWVMMVCSCLALIVSGWQLYREERDNAAVAALLAGHDLAVDPERASPSVLFARFDYLLERDRTEEAQMLLDQANFRADQVTRIAMLYNMANARLRQTFAAIDKGDFEAATSLVGLAKEDYIAALRLDPGAWNVKYNLDVAAR
ncbi:MAG TPA: hypothetical protein VNN13_09280, partial [Methylomirabilota bacterium]|nr:hypothetical protein [Methylomirabilota bacterium]